MTQQKNDHVEMHALVSGRVQGVGFRAVTRRYSGGLELKGWVKNLPDGRVEILAQGKKENLEKLVTQLRETNGTIHIDHIDVSFRDIIEHFSDFR